MEGQGFFFFFSIKFILPKEPQPFKNKAAPHPGSSSNSIFKNKSINIWLGFRV